MGPLHALSQAVDMEKDVTRRIKNIIDYCSAAEDHHAADWLTADFMEEQLRGQPLWWVTTTPSGVWSRSSPPWPTGCSTTSSKHKIRALATEREYPQPPPSMHLKTHKKKPKKRENQQQQQQQHNQMKLIEPY